MSETKVIPEDFHKWSEAEAAQAGFPTDIPDINEDTKAPIFTTFVGAQVGVNGGETYTSFFCTTSDGAHVGTGYAYTFFQSGVSNGRVYYEDWELLKTTYYMTVTSINNSLFIHFVTPLLARVGVFNGDWKASELSRLPGTGYFWWRR